MRRDVRLPILILICLFALASMSCRGATRPEAGLPASIFSGEQFPFLTSNARHQWHLVVAPDADIGELVVIDGGESGPLLYYGVPKGERTVQLLPVSPDGLPRLEALDGQRIEARFVDDPTTLKLQKTVGYLESADARVDWLGENPRGDQAVALVPATLANAPTFHEWVVGVAASRDGDLLGVTVEDGAKGPFFVLPDGTLRPEQQTLVELGGGRAFSKLTGLNVRSSKKAFPNVRQIYRYHARPLGQELGADVIAGKLGDVHVVSAAAPTRMNGIPISVTSDPLEVHVDDTAARFTVLGVAAASQKHPLTASYFLKPEFISVAGVDAAGDYRIAELAGAAHRPEWTTHSLLADARGIDADVALYVARANALAGRDAAARRFAQRARDQFYSWYSPNSELGIGRTDALDAAIVFRQGDASKATDLALSAAEMLDEGGDALGAAETELETTVYALAAGRDAEAVKAGMLARSRFYHGNSVYYTALAEMRLADVHNQVGDVEEALEVAGYAVQRFEELGHAVGANRARMAKARAVAKHDRSAALTELVLAYEEAEELGDEQGAADAAASIVLVGGGENPEEVARYGNAMALVAGSHDSLMASQRNRQGLAVLCGQGLSNIVKSAGYETAGVVEQTCDRLGGEQAGDAMVDLLLNKGYEQLQSASMKEARETGQRLATLADEEFRSKNARKAADIEFFLALLAHNEESPDDAQARIRTGVELLGGVTDPTRAAEMFARMSETQLRRGFPWLAAHLLGAAIESAARQGQNQLRRELALERIVILHAAGDWDAVLRAANDAEPVIEQAGPGSSWMLSRVDLYREDALRRLERTADARRAAEDAFGRISGLEAPRQVEAFLLSAELALSRGAREDARKDLDRAEGLEKGLPENLDVFEERKIWRAEASLLRGEMFRNVGQYGQAYDRLKMAADGLTDLETLDAVELRIQALGRAGAVAPSRQDVDAAKGELEELTERVANEHPRLLPAIVFARARLLVLDGEASNALSLIEERGVSASSVEGACILGKARLLSGEPESAEQPLRRCERSAPTSDALDARLLLMVVQTSTAREKRTQLAIIEGEAGAGLTERDRERIKLIGELLEGTEEADAREDGRLQKALEEAAAAEDNQEIVEAVIAVVHNFVTTGRASRALEVLDEHSGAFYDATRESPARLVRLRLQAMVHAVVPLDTLNYALRAVSEVENAAPETDAGITLAVARNDAVLGLWHHARRQIATGLESARRARGDDIEEQMKAFTSRFHLEIDTE